MRRIALTFDDGPSEWTSAILDLLDAHEAHATFFLIGESIAGREEIVMRAARADHDLGNHTWSHRKPQLLSDDELAAEVQRTRAEIERVTGVTPQWLRPPYGQQPERFKPLGHTVLWTMSPHDWGEPSADSIVSSTLAQLHPDGIVLLHDGFPRQDASAAVKAARPEVPAGLARRQPLLETRQPTVDAVAKLLPALAARGYRCVTLSALESTHTRRARSRKATAKRFLSSTVLAGMNALRDTGKQR